VLRWSAANDVQRGTATSGARKPAIRMEWLKRRE
jgi:hypothetical protein